MNIPPLSMWLEIRSPERRTRRIWLPLFIVWIILAPIVALALLCALVADAVLLAAGREYHRYTRLLIACLDLVGETRGTVVKVDAPDSVVHFVLS